MVGVDFRLGLIGLPVIGSSTWHQSAPLSLLASPSSPMVLAIALAVVGRAVVAVVVANVIAVIIAVVISFAVAVVSAVVGAVLMVVMSPVSFYISLLYLFSIKRIRGGEKEEERKK